MAYGIEIQAEAKRLIVWHGYTPQEASDHFGGSPAASTIHNWCKTKRNDMGESWFEERDRLAAERYELTSPQAMAQTVIQKIHEVMAAPGFDTKRANQLANLSKHLRHFVDPRYHVSTALQVLTEFLHYLREHHPDAISQELTGAVREFKSEQRKKIEG